MKNEIIITEDGSNSLFIKELDETYHSIHGAWNESMHIFIKNGLNLINKEQVSIFEVGFGTGLNALLTCFEAENQNKKINYHSVEAFPIEIDLHKKLNYSQLTKEYYKNDKDYFNLLINAEWNKKVIISRNLALLKEKKKIQNTFLDNLKYDIIFFDAFAPNKQEEMWTNEIFTMLFNATTDGGHLVTYCAKGSVKRLLKSVGYTVENVPGPPGKREITLAFKK